MLVQALQSRHWFVLTTADPKDSEEQLRRENVKRDSLGATVFNFVVPAQLLKRRVSQQAPQEYADEMLDDSNARTDITSPTSRAAVAQNNETRSALRRYLFIYGCEAEIDIFLSGAWNKLHHNRIQFFYDRERKRSFVPQQAMDDFVKMLADKRLDFELTPSCGTLEKGEPIQFRNNMFAGQTVRVVDSKRTAGGNVLTVELDLIGNTLRLQVQNVRDEDIIPLEEGRTKYAKNNELIKCNQKHLLAILSRRINKKETEQTRVNDMLILNTMYATRFRHFDENEVVAYRHFIAQMLICACLRHDKDGITTYTDKALSELSEINKQSESKAATDVRARLHSALFLSTKIPDFRTKARDYIRDRQPKSEMLKRLVRLISKRQALNSL